MLRSLGLGKEGIDRRQLLGRQCEWLLDEHCLAGLQAAKHGLA